MARGRRGRLRIAAVPVALLSAAGMFAGCSSSSAAPVHASLSVDAPTALADRPVHMTVSGLPPGAAVTVTAEATDQWNVAWRSHADFHADAGGRVSLDTAKPVSGTYQGADGMGLFWSMTPAKGDPSAASFDLPPRSSDFSVTLSVSADGRTLATRRLTREWSGPGVTSRVLTLAADRVVGKLFMPPAGTPRHPAVLLLGGSEGGNTEIGAAELLASHGYPSLALGYFRLPGLPPNLEDIPLEYFATAARLLAGLPGVDPARVLALGYSRGTEAALLLADRYPGLIHGAVVYAPSAQVNPGLPDPATYAWTQGGKPLPPDVIALDHVDGPVLAFAGTDDTVWTSFVAAPQINHELAADHDRYPHQDVVYPDAGHMVGTYPYVPKTFATGGSQAGNAAARAASWPRVLALLAADHP